MTRELTRELREMAESAGGYWVIKSGKPYGEMYSRQVYLAFSEAEAKTCEQHILDEFDGVDVDWVDGPHVYFRPWNEGWDPTEERYWNGHEHVVPPVAKS